MQHIPQGETRELELLPFDDALRLAQEPAPDYDVSRWLYVPKVYSEYRYILGTRGKKPLICMGINPSTAIPDRLDNTLKSVERIALANGYDSFLMFNVYAQRATDPDAMERRCNDILHQENLKAFQYLLSLSPQPAIWAAWGAIIEKRDYLATCPGPGSRRPVVYRRSHLQKGPSTSSALSPEGCGFGSLRSGTLLPEHPPGARHSKIAYHSKNNHAGKGGVPSLTWLFSCYEIPATGDLACTSSRFVCCGFFGSRSGARQMPPRPSQGQAPSRPRRQS